MTTKIDVQKYLDNRGMTSRQKMAIALCMVLSIADGITTTLIGLVIPSLSAEWDVTPASLTPIAVTASIALAAGVLFLAPIADKIGRRKFIIACGSLATVGTFAASFATSPFQLAAAMAVAGLAYGAVPAALFTYCAEMAPEQRRGIIVTVIGGGLAVGAALGGFLAGILIPSNGWQSIFVATATLLLIVTVLAFKLLPETLQFLAVSGDQEKARKAFGYYDPAAAADKELVLEMESTTAGKQKVSLATVFADGRGAITAALWAAYFCTVMCSLFIFVWLPTVLIETGVDAKMAFYVTATYSLGALTCTAVTGAGMDKFPQIYQKFYVVAAAFGVGIVGIIFSAFVTDSIAMLFVAIFIAGFGTGGTGAALMPLAAAIYPTQVRATAIGWVNGMGRIGGVVGPGVGGALIGLGLSSTGILLTALVPQAICILASVAAIFILKAKLDSRQLASDRV